LFQIIQYHAITVDIEDGLPSHLHVCLFEFSK
jgi:hypothetical protein